MKNVINKAKLACKNSNIKVDDHFANAGKMVDICSNTKRITKDFRLTRYACYLIAQNGNSRKEVIALAQTYFAIQTRKQELDDIFKRKKLRYREDILDNMGSEELADNIFRIAQTDAKLKRDNVD